MSVKNTIAYIPERSGTGMATYEVVYKGGIKGNLGRGWFTSEGYKVNLKRSRIKVYATPEAATAAARRRWFCNQ